MCKRTKDIDNSNSMLSKRNFLYGSLWIFLIVGVILYVIVYACNGLMPNLQSDNWIIQHQHGITLFLSIIEKIADILVIGAALGYLSNAALFLDLFKKDLEEIVIDNKHLELRSDIEIIWDRVTRVLFNSRFEKISEYLLPLIRDNYFPKNKSVYYDNYTSDVKISWEGNPEDEVLNVKMENKYIVISENRDKIEIPWKSWTKPSEEYKIITNQLFIDGKEIKDIKRKEENEFGEETFEMTIPLCDKDRYDVRAFLEKQYSFKNDFFRAYSASYIMNGMILSISHPADMIVELVDRGTCYKFEKISQTSTTLVARYNGLILPHQGYVLVMKHNK